MSREYKVEAAPLLNRTENIFGYFEHAMRKRVSEECPGPHEGAMPEGWLIDVMLFGQREWP